jgi:hypothetical protein
MYHLMYLQSTPMSEWFTTQITGIWTVSIMYVFMHLQNTAIPKRFIAHITFIWKPPFMCLVMSLHSSLPPERFVTCHRYEPFASSGLKVQPQCGLSDVKNPPSSPCPYMVTGMMIGWWIPVKGARVSSPRFLGELSDWVLVTRILVVLFDTSWVGPGQPRERTGPLWGPLAGAVDAGACGGGKLCLAVGAFWNLVLAVKPSRASVSRICGHRLAEAGASGGLVVRLHVFGLLSFFSFLFCV